MSEPSSRPAGAVPFERRHADAPLPTSPAEKRAMLRSLVDGGTVSGEDLELARTLLAALSAEEPPEERLARVRKLAADGKLSPVELARARADFPDETIAVPVEPETALGPGMAEADP